MGRQSSDYLSALQGMPPFTVYTVGEQGLEVYCEIRGEDVIPALWISDYDLGGQCERSAAEVAWWSRIAAQCERAHDWAKRDYARWKSQFRIDHAADEHPTTGKKVTQAQLEDLYRVDPGYEAVNALVEETREAAESARGIADAFRAKRENLSRWVWRARDQSLQGLHV